MEENERERTSEQRKRKQFLQDPWNIQVEISHRGAVWMLGVSDRCPVQQVVSFQG